MVTLNPGGSDIRHKDPNFVLKHQLPWFEIRTLKVPTELNANFENIRA